MTIPCQVSSLIYVSLSSNPKFKFRWLMLKEIKLEDRQNYFMAVPQACPKNSCVLEASSYLDKV